MSASQQLDARNPAIKRKQQYYRLLVYYTQCWCVCVCKCVSVYDSQLLGLLLNFFKLEELFHISLLFICPFVVIVFGREERHQSDGFGQLDHWFLMLICSFFLFVCCCCLRSWPQIDTGRTSAPYPIILKVGIDFSWLLNQWWWSCVFTVHLMVLSCFWEAKVASHRLNYELNGPMMLLLVDLKTEPTVLVFSLRAIGSEFVWSRSWIEKKFEWRWLKNVANLSLVFDLNWLRYWTDSVIGIWLAVIEWTCGIQLVLKKDIRFWILWTALN